MKHDFRNENPDDERFSSTGEPCTKIGGYMDYQPIRNKWSACSVEDFYKYFSECQLDPDFCLPIADCLGKYNAMSN